MHCEGPTYITRTIHATSASLPGESAVCEDVTDEVAGIIDARRYRDVILMQAFKQVRCRTTSTGLSI